MTSTQPSPAAPPGNPFGKFVVLVLAIVAALALYDWLRSPSAADLRRAEEERMDEENKRWRREFDARNAAADEALKRKQDEIRAIRAQTPR